jgi:hypothetical protein
MKKSLNFDIRKFTKITAIAASFLMVIGIGAFTYFHQSTYVSLDVNPSLEFSLNMYDRVLSVKGVNDDGVQILENVDLDNLSNKTIDEAIKLTVQNITEQGYFDGDTTGEMVITVSGKDLKKSAELADKLKKISEETASEKNATVEVEAEGVGKERVEQAKELGITPGKLRLIEKLKESANDPESIKVDDWKNKSVKEIQKATRAKKTENLLSEDQKTLIEPALEAFKAAVVKAGEDFNTAFDAIKTNYIQQINDLKAQYTDSGEMKKKLNELRIKMLEERRAELTKLSEAVEKAKETFIKATENLGLSEDVLFQYVKFVSEATVNPNDGYKDFLSLFAAADNKNKKTESKTESKTDTKSKENDSKTTGNDNSKSSTSTDNGNVKDNSKDSDKDSSKDSTKSNSKIEKDTSSQTESGSAVTNSKPADKDKKNEQKTENKQNDQSDQQKEQQSNSDTKAKNNGKGN